MAHSSCPQARQSGWNAIKILQSALIADVLGRFNANISLRILAFQSLDLRALVAVDRLGGDRALVKWWGAWCGSHI